MSAPRRRRRRAATGCPRWRRRPAASSPGPQPVALAIGRHRWIHEAVRAADAVDPESTLGEAHPGVADHPLLRADDHRLDVPHHRVEGLALVQPIAPELGDVVLPEALPPGQDELLELAVGGDEDLGGARFETDPALDAEDGLAEVDAAADAVGGEPRVECLHELGSGQDRAVEAHRETGLPADDEIGRGGRFHVGRRPRVLGRALPRVVGPAAAEGRAPETAVDRVASRLRAGPRDRAASR